MKIPFLFVIIRKGNKIHITLKIQSYIKVYVIYVKLFCLRILLFVCIIDGFCGFFIVL